MRDLLDLMNRKGWVPQVIFFIVLGVVGTTVPIAVATDMGPIGAMFLAAGEIAFVVVALFFLQYLIWAIADLFEDEDEEGREDENVALDSDPDLSQEAEAVPDGASSTQA